MPAAKADPNQISQQDGESPLILAAQEGQEAVVDSLIRFGADVNATNKDRWTVLMLATGRGRTAVVEMLLRLVDDVNRSITIGEVEVTALKLARDFEHSVSVRTLCESNESVGRGGLLKSGAQM